MSNDPTDPTFWEMVIGWAFVATVFILLVLALSQRQAIRRMHTQLDSLRREIREMFEHHEHEQTYSREIRDELMRDRVTDLEIQQAVQPSAPLPVQPLRPDLSNLGVKDPGEET